MSGPSAHNFSLLVFVYSNGQMSVIGLGSGLLSLLDDVIYRIISYLLLTRLPGDILIPSNKIENLDCLISLSSTCRRIRHLVAPFIFKHVSFRNGYTDYILRSKSEVKIPKIDGFTTDFPSYPAYVESTTWTINYPNANTVKGLAYDFSVLVPIQLPNLQFLSINVKNIGPFLLIVPQLTRLDLLVDFTDSLGPIESLCKALESSRLHELNLFIKPRAAVRYSLTTNLVHSVKKLNVLGIREVRGQDFGNANYETDDNVFLDLPQLEFLTIDLSFLQFEFNFSQGVLRKACTLVLVEPSLVVPQFQPQAQLNIQRISSYLGVTHINLQYGDPMIHSDLSALNILQRFLESYNKIKTVSVYQSWSTINETIIRESNASVMPWEKLDINTPNFRVYFEYQVNYERVSLIPTPKTSRVQDIFQSSELSFVELGLYGQRPKKRSSLWD